MKYLIVYFLIITNSLFGQIADLPSLIAKVDPAVVKVYVLDDRGEPVSQGSGVAINTNGTFITNFHVLEGARKAVILTPEGKQHEVGKILDYSADKDLIKFTVNSKGASFKAVEISTELPLKGSNVFSLGYPNGFLLEGESTVSTGIISGSRTVGENKLIQTTTPITHGSSGGGLFDNKGLLIGITTGTFAGNVEDLHANMNKVVPAYEINTLVQKYNWTLEELYLNTRDLTCYLTGLALYNQEEYMQAFTVFNDCLEERKYDPKIFYLMGTCLFHIGRGATSEGYTQPDKEILTRALDFYKAALEIEQDYVPVFCYSSMILEYLGDLENAFTLAQKAYELNPQSPFSNYALAKQYANKDDWKEAHKYMRNAIIIAEEKENNKGYLHQYYLELAIFSLMIGEQTNSDNYFEKSIELNSMNMDAYFHYGLSLKRRQLFDKACNYLTQLQNLSPHYAIPGIGSVKNEVEELKCKNPDQGSIKEVKIGLQIWMAENLNVEHFRNGDPIPQAKTKEEWIKAGNEGKPAWCYYNNDKKNRTTYGKLYNWYAVNDPRGLAPEGWRVPSLDNWKYLIQYLGGNEVAGKKMKVGFINDTSSTNSSGFSARAGGSRLPNGLFNGGLGLQGWYWAFTVDGIGMITLYSDFPMIDAVEFEMEKVKEDFDWKRIGFSVRCVKEIENDNLKKPILIIYD